MHTYTVTIKSLSMAYFLQIYMNIGADSKESKFIQGSEVLRCWCSCHVHHRHETRPTVSTADNFFTKLRYFGPSFIKNKKRKGQFVQVVFRKHSLVSRFFCLLLHTGFQFLFLLESLIIHNNIITFFFCYIYNFSALLLDIMIHSSSACLRKI